jgi:hypothetical protein
LPRGRIALVVVVSGASQTRKQLPHAGHKTRQLNWVVALRAANLGIIRLLTGTALRRRFGIGSGRGVRDFSGKPLGIEFRKSGQVIFRARLLSSPAAVGDFQGHHLMNEDRALDTGRLLDKTLQRRPFALTQGGFQFSAQALHVLGRLPSQRGQAGAGCLIHPVSPRSNSSGKELIGGL